MIELGQVVRDKLTGVEGTAVARTTYMYGCVRISVQPRELKDGRPVEWVTIDEPQLEVVTDTRAEKVEPTHGPKPAVTHRPEVTR